MGAEEASTCHCSHCLSWQLAYEALGCILFFSLLLFLDAMFAFHPKQGACATRRNTGVVYLRGGTVFHLVSLGVRSSSATAEKAARFLGPSRKPLWVHLGACDVVFFCGYAVRCIFMVFCIHLYRRYQSYCVHNTRSALDQQFGGVEFDPSLEHFVS